MFPHTDQFHTSITLSCSFLSKCTLVGFINHCFSNCKLFARHGLKIWLRFYDMYPPGDIWIQVFGVTWVFTALETEAASALSPTHGTTFSQHEGVPVYFLCHAQTWAAKPPLFRQVMEKPAGLWIINCSFQHANSDRRTAGSMALEFSSNRKARM